VVFVLEAFKQQLENRRQQKDNNEPGKTNVSRKKATNWETSISRKKVANWDF
jgi:hypothetical protein